MYDLLVDLKISIERLFIKLKDIDFLNKINVLVRKVNYLWLGDYFEYKFGWSVVKNVNKGLVYKKLGSYVGGGELNENLVVLLELIM